MNYSFHLQKKYSSGFELNASVKTSSKKLGVFGPSGSGKSTLMRLLAGWEVPDRGSIRVNHHILLDCEKKVCKKPEHRHIAMIFQDTALFPHLNVEQNLRYGYERQQAVANRKIVEKCIRILKLEPLLKRRIGCLSGGEKQRVAIGRAVLAMPDLLILDEPLSGLDDVMKMSIAAYLKALCAQLDITYIFISHSVLEMQLMTEEVVGLKAGRLQFHQPTADWLKRQMFCNGRGFVNMLDVAYLERKDGMHVYAWGGVRLMASKKNGSTKATARLTSRDIVLFKRHPAAVSARNLLKCTIQSLWRHQGRVGLELCTGGQVLIAEIVKAAAHEMGLRPGASVYAAIKASAFQFQ